MNKEDILEIIKEKIKNYYDADDGWSLACGSYLNGEILNLETILEIIENTIKYDIYL